MSRFEVPRPDLEDALRQRARSGAPLLLTGPPGAGKTTLLRGLVPKLHADGLTPVSLDLMGAASTPERFVLAALSAIPAEGLGRHLPQATEIRRLAGAGRLNGEKAVRGLFSLWTSLDSAGGRPVVLLLDEATEIRSLAYFPGLREVHAPFAEALAARKRGTILATSFPTAARRLFAFEVLALRPFAATELEPVVGDSSAAEEVIRGSAGLPRYARILLERLDRRRSVAEVWANAMAFGEPLELACRATYESLLLRSRGYGACKAVLAAVAMEEGLNLTALAQRLGRTPGAVRDYLQWLVAVDAIRMARKRYVYVDAVLRHWVRLHGRGHAPSAAEIRAAAAECVAAASGPAGTSEPTAAADERVPQPRHDALMEID